MKIEINHGAGRERSHVGPVCISRTHMFAFFTPPGRVCRATSLNN
jgi:hypothetical protein